MTAVPVTGLVPAINMLPMTAAGQLMPAAYGQEWAATAAEAAVAAGVASASPASSASPPAAAPATADGMDDKSQDFIKDLQAEKESLEASTDDNLQKANTIKLLEQGKKTGNSKKCLGLAQVPKYVVHQK